MLGAEISSGTIASGAGKFSAKLDMSGLAKGMYFLKISDGSTSFTKKLSKQ
jgi:hypothetical protein